MGTQASGAAEEAALPTTTLRREGRNPRALPRPGAEHVAGGAFDEENPPGNEEAESNSSASNQDVQRTGSEDGNENLAVAQNVENLPEGIVEGRHQHGTNLPQSGKKKEKLMLCAMAILLLVVLVVAGTMVLMMEDKEAPQDNSEKKQLTGVNTLISFDEGFLSLLAEQPETVKDIQLEGTPQHQALQWLLDDPAWKTYSDARILQRFAVATFFLSTGGEDWYDSTHWMSYEQHECDWFLGGQSPEVEFHALINGLFKASIRQATGGTNNACADRDGVMDEQEIKHIALLSNNLKGTIPRQIFLLTGLRSLYLYSNSISGTIPLEVAQVGQLERFVVSPSHFKGSIPSVFGAIPTLRSLILISSNLQGPIPSQLGLIRDLEYLWLDDNSLTGSMPTELANIQNLKWLWLLKNQLTGSLPTQIGAMPSLWNLWMSDNPTMQGPIPTQLGQLSALYNLEPFEEDVVNQLPKILARIFQQRMGQIRMNSMHFTGGIPSQLRLLVDSKALVLMNNHLTGPIPTELGLMTHLTHLQLRINELSGTLPSQLGQLSLLERLYVDQNNDLTGPLPTQLGLLTSLKSIILNSTGLTGTIPPSLCELGLSNYMHSGVHFDCSESLCGCLCPCPEV